MIIRKHNERVKPGDTVFFLGDFIFKGGKEGGEDKYREFEFFSPFKNKRTSTSKLSDAK